MPDEVRAEISPWFIEKQAIEEESPEKIEKLDEKALFVNSDLKVDEINFYIYCCNKEVKLITHVFVILQPKRSDLDMNHHVNNVKYVRWMLDVRTQPYYHIYKAKTSTH